MESADMMKIGRFGSLIWLVGIVLALIVALLAVNTAASSQGSAGSTAAFAMAVAVTQYSWLVIISSLMVIAGILMVSTGGIGLYKKYGGILCLLGSVLGIATAVSYLLPLAVGASAGLAILSAFLLPAFMLVLGFGLTKLPGVRPTEMISKAGGLFVIAGIMSFMGSFVSAMIALLGIISTIIATALLYIGFSRPIGTGA
jgi:hypothetical protein